MMITMLDAVFFDLDGTLLDTARDLTTATNAVLVYHGLPTKSYEFIRPLIGGGTHQIITRCFDIAPQEKRYLLYRQQLLEAYQQTLAQQTCFFPGIPEVLDLLEQHDTPWGIITNKPYWLAQPLLEQLNHKYFCHCLIGREILLTQKPSPEPLLYACQAARVAAQNSVYIGDAKSDIIAAKRANMQSIAAVYGYIDHNDQPHSWEADHMIDSATDLLTWLSPRLNNNLQKGSFRL